MKISEAPSQNVATRFHQSYLGAARGRTMAKVQIPSDCTRRTMMLWMLCIEQAGTLANGEAFVDGDWFKERR